MRSAIHPSIFAGVYWLASWLSTSLKLPATWHADLLVAAPKVTQALFAALGDYYTWRLASKTYGHESKEAWAAVCRDPQNQSNTVMEISCTRTETDACYVMRYSSS